MNLILTNPLGLLALLGIPALVVIYFLQRRAKVIPASTLFLLEKTQRESSAGRRFETFTTSLPFWLQLLAILLLTWILVLPRYLSSHSTQRVAIVLDSSASMQVFKSDVLSTFQSDLPTLRGTAARAEYFVIDHDPSRPRIYQGDDLAELLEALEAWTPTDGAVDPAGALRIARTLAGTEGIVLYVTDHAGETLPLSAQRLSVGHSIQNCGFTGVSFEEKEGAVIWTALIRNFSDEAQTRQWSVQTPDGRRTEDQSVTLQPGAIATIQGRFPEGSPRCEIHLSPDSFTQDDILPLIIPQPKTLFVEANLSSKYRKLDEKIIKGFSGLQRSTDSAETDLQIIAYDPLLPILPEDNAIVLIDESTTGRKYLAGGIFAEVHPLIDGLNWQPLAARDCTQIEVLSSDRVLLWQKERPLIILRNALIPATETAPERSYQQLIFNFDLSRSNALRIPATAVLLHRFCESLRKQKIAYQALNLESAEPLNIPAEATAKFTPLGATDAVPYPLTISKAPRAPGFLEISHQNQPLLSAAIHFADTREADLAHASAVNEVSSNGSAVQLHTRSDKYWRLWVLLTLALLLAAWYLTRPKQSVHSAEQPS